MKLKTLAIVLSLLVAGPTLAQKVYIDYDPEYPAKTIETYGWDASAGESIKSKSELLHDRIVSAIERHLDAAGLRKAAGVDDVPDVYVTYHTSVQETVKLNTENFGYFVPTSWYWGPYGVGVAGTSSGEAQMRTWVKSYERGTLVVDVWDAESKQLIWRGTAPGIAVSWSPKKIEKRLEKALRKMVAQWRKIRDGGR